MIKPTRQPRPETTALRDRPFLAVALSLANAIAAPARAQTTPAVEQEIAEAERARLDAEVRSDPTVLRSLIGDDLVYVHGSGIQQSRDEYLNAFVPGKPRYLGETASEQTVAAYGAFAVVHGKKELKFADGRDVLVRYTSVFARRGGHWLLISSQSTPVIPPPPAATH